MNSTDVVSTLGHSFVCEIMSEDQTCLVSKVCIAADNNVINARKDGLHKTNISEFFKNNHYCQWSDQQDCILDPYDCILASYGHMNLYLLVG